MNIKKLRFKGFFLIKPLIHKDSRGVFFRNFCERELKKKKINILVKQGNVSVSLKKGTLRGFHYKESPSKEYKIISCLTGSIFHSAVDLRKDSKTFMQSFNIELKSSDNYSLIIPPLCANAFLTLENNTIIHYYMGDFFENKKFKGFRYNDPLLKINWPFRMFML